MTYFKHRELSDTYHVSLKTIHNWIIATKQGKFDLELYEIGDRTYIVDSPDNTVRLVHLANEGKKYRNALHAKMASPKPEFYKLFTQRQILDIMSNLKIHREIPNQYSYLDGGASNWDNWAQHMAEEAGPNILKSTIGLIQDNLNVIDHLIEGKTRVNVIDLGPGNGLAVRELLAHLLERGVLNRYIAVDISAEMLHIVERNIKEWFGGKVRYEGHVRDFSFERFDDLLVDDMLAVDASKTLNMAMLLGGTLLNFRSPYDLLKVASGSLAQDDLLLYTQKPDSEQARRYLNFNPETKDTLSPMDRFLLDMLNIDKSFYDVEMGFSEEKRVRSIQVRLKVALTIRFSFTGHEQDIMLDKGDLILLWRVWHRTAPEIISGFEKNGFTLLQSSLTKDRQFLMTISGLNAETGLQE